jgi:hypothetical protein
MKFRTDEKMHWILRKWDESDGQQTLRKTPAHQRMKFCAEFVELAFAPFHIDGSQCFPRIRICFFCLLNFMDSYKRKLKSLSSVPFLYLSLSQNVSAFEVFLGCHFGNDGYCPSLS